MPLQSSGAIALDDIHQEAGGSANSNCSINDADIRDLIDASDGANTSFDDWYGATASLPGDIMLIGQGVASDSVGADTVYITITSTGNTTDFGELIAGRMYQSFAASNSTRALIGGGYTTDPYEITNVVQYLTINTLGDGTDFGDASSSVRQPSAVSYATRVISAGGDGGSGNINTIEYYTIANTGNATDFGDLTTVMTNGNGNINSTTRGIFVGGDRGGSGGKSNIMDYITMANTGNATDFGDISGGAAIKNNSGCCSSTRGIIFFGSNGGTFSNEIGYITIGSTGNSSDFGDLTFGRYKHNGGSNKTRGICAAGRGPLNGVNNSVSIDYVTIASTGNATDFGDMSKNTEESWAATNSHGGLS